MWTKHQQTKHQQNIQHHHRIKSAKQKKIQYSNTHTTQKQQKEIALFYNHIQLIHRMKYATKKNRQEINTIPDQMIIINNKYIQM